jgi:hypothetical protein
MHMFCLLTHRKSAHLRIQLLFLLAYARDPRDTDLDNRIAVVVEVTGLTHFCVGILPVRRETFYDGTRSVVSTWYPSVVNLGLNHELTVAVSLMRDMHDHNALFVLMAYTWAIPCLMRGSEPRACLPCRPDAATQSTIPLA